MKTIKDTLKVKIETWHDPGDYPSNAGAGPLPSRDYVEDIEGILEVELEDEDIKAMEGDLGEESIKEYLADNAREIDHSIEGKITKWILNGVERSEDGPLVLTLEVEEFEDVEPEEWEPMEDEYEEENW